MLTIRLQRKGKKNQPFFKIIVTEEKKSSTRGRFVEQLGFYNPLTKERSLNGDRAKYWMSVGAQPSDTVYNMLVTDNVIEGKKRPKHKKSKKKQEEPEATSTPTPVPETPQETPVKKPAKTEEPTKTDTEPAEEPAKDEEAAEKPKEAKAPQEQPQETPESQPEKAKEKPQRNLDKS